MPNTKTVKLQNNPDLRQNCLSFFDVLAQSVAGISPSGTPAFTIPAVFILAGNGTWFAYLFAMISVLLVGLHINIFSTRKASSGALHTFVSDGIGPGAGFLSGSSLVFAYLLTGAAVIPLFANFVNIILGSLHLPSVSGIFLCIFGIGSALFVVCKDVKISTRLMLTTEIISITMICTLGVIIFVRSNFTVYTQLLSMKHVSLGSIRLGLVLAFFSFIGFESASSLGHEAKNPLKNIPKAILISAAFVGIFFTAFSLLEIAGFATAGMDLAKSTAPLNDLAQKYGIGILGLFISLFAFTSFWSCCVACITAGSRIVYNMGNQKLVPAALSRVHKKNGTPHVAASIIAFIMLLIPVVMLLCKTDPMLIFSYVGTIATFGFLLSYILVVVSAPFFLKKRNEMKVSHIILAVITFGILLIPFIGSVYPLPAFPFSLFPFLFLAWVVLSILWYVYVSRKSENKSLSVELESQV